MAKHLMRCFAFAFIHGICIFIILFALKKDKLPTPKILNPSATLSPTGDFTSAPPPLQSSCPVPDFDPYDPRFLHYFEGDHWKACVSTQPDLVYKSSRFELSTDPELMIVHGVEYCTYQQIERIDGKDDFSLKYYPPINFTQTAYVNSVVAKVNCFRNRKALYERVFYFIKKVNTIKRSKGSMNVLIYVLDSLSRLSSYRFMPQIHDFMKKKLKSYVFRYHIKTGMDTTPNLSAAMTGKRSFKYRNKGKTYPAELPHCSTDECNDDFVDDWPFVWKDFAKVGYVTALGESYSFGSIWNYGMKGFKNPPTDYYMRTFRLAWEWSDKRQADESMGECVQNTPYYQKVLEWSEEVIRSNRDQPLFGLFVTDFGHDDNLLYKEVDRPFTEMLSKLYNEGLLNDSIVIIVGDHGLSLSAYRATWRGRLEDSMPLFSVSLPSWFKENYPKVGDALDHNTGRLTSWYDVHAMLKDIVHQRFDGGTHQKMQRGMSLLKKIWHNRTCEDAGIPPMYCPCYQPKQLSNTSAFVVEAGKKVLERLNRELKDYEEFCAELKLSHVLSAQALLNPNDVTANSPDLRVVVVAEPSKGLYEAVLVYDTTINSHYIDSEVLRVDLYRDQTGCIRHSVLEAFCYCTTNISQLSHEGQKLFLKSSRLSQSNGSVSNNQ